MKISSKTAIVVSESFNTTANLTNDIVRFMSELATYGPGAAYEWAGQCGCCDGNWNIWQPIVDALAGHYEPDNLDHLRDDPNVQLMDYLTTPPATL